MHLPPGPLYLLQNLPSLVTPPAITFLSAKVLRRLEIEVPAWAIVLACCLSLPVAISVRVQYRNIRDHREAALQGAIMPTQIYDKWPGGMTLLAKMVNNIKDGYPGDIFVEWSETYGNTWNFKALFENRFFTTEPEYIKAILATQFHNFEKGEFLRGPDFNNQMQYILGTGVFNSDGDRWKFHRSMTRPFFSKDRISHFDIFDRHATEALSQLKARLREGVPVDIQDLASRFTMDSATEFLFNKNVHSLGVGLPYPHYLAHLNTAEQFNHPATKFSRAFGEAQKLMTLRSRRGINWPLSEFWKDKISEQMLIVNGFIEPIMRAAVERKELSRTGGPDVSSASEFSDKEREVKDGESLLDHLIHYTDDETVLRDEIVNILLAGRDTTTNSITCALYMLSEHPDVFQRLRNEVLEKVGASRRPTFEDMKEMKYLRAVINETLRLYPAVPFNVRTTRNPVILPGKYGNKPFYLPAHSRTQYSVMMMHQRKDLWGPDADFFDPDRFLDDRLKKYVTPNPFIFLPFNAGPRICLGQQFAYHETSFFLIRLLQQFSSISHVFDAQPPDSHPPAAWGNSEGPKGRDKIRMKSYLTMSVAGGCWVKMEEAF